MLPYNAVSPAHPFSGFVLNLNVTTLIHRDGGDKELCVVLVFSDCVGGELCLKEPGVVLDLRLGNLVIFPSTKISHFNLHFAGKRASIVFYTDKEIERWASDQNGWRHNVYLRTLSWCTYVFGYVITIDHDHMIVFQIFVPNCHHVNRRVCFVEYSSSIQNASEEENDTGRNAEPYSSPEEATRRPAKDHWYDLTAEFMNSRQQINADVVPFPWLSENLNAREKKAPRDCEISRPKGQCGRGANSGHGGYSLEKSMGLENAHYLRIQVMPFIFIISGFQPDQAVITANC